MTLIRWGEIPGKRGGKATGSELTDKIDWLIETDSPRESIYTLLNYMAGLIPSYLDPHPQNPFATLRSYSYGTAEATIGKGAYVLTGDFSSAPITQEEKEKKEKNPTLRKARTKWGKTTVPEVVDKDIDGNAVINTAGDPFDPPVEKSARRWTATVTKNLPAVPTWLLDYNQECVNDGPITIDGVNVLSHAAKLIDLTISEEQEENNVPFRTVVMTFEFKKAPEGGNFKDGTSEDDPRPDKEPKPWDLVLLNQGLRERRPLDAGGYEIVAMTDDNGDQLTSPALLDEGGEKLTNPYPAAAIYLVWEQYEAKDFSLLPLL